MNKLPAWQKKYIDLLSKDGLHHAYLFFGRGGLGKQLLLSNLSQGILCEDTSIFPCGECQNCKLFLSQNHPDFHNLSIEEGKKNISIAQVIDLREKIYESSFLGKSKIILISNIESMSRDASDSILKILEEPPKNTFFIMSSNFIHLIPSTIRSRSVEIEIQNPSIEECREWLSESYSENIDLAIELAENRPFIARDLLELNLLELRSTFIKDISGIIKSGKDIVNISENWNKEQETLPLKIEWMSSILVLSLIHI